MSERNTDKSDDNETESELRSEKNYKVECENNSMTSIIRESEEEMKIVVISTYAFKVAVAQCNI